MTCIVSPRVKVGDYLRLRLSDEIRDFYGIRKTDIFRCVCAASSHLLTWEVLNLRTKDHVIVLVDEIILVPSVKLALEHGKHT